MNNEKLLSTIVLELSPRDFETTWTVSEDATYFFHQGAPLWRHRPRLEGDSQERDHGRQPTREPHPGSPQPIPSTGHGGEGEQGNEQGE